MQASDEDWRSHWVVSDNEDGLGLPAAVHDSGLAFDIVFSEVDDEGNRGWCAAPRHYLTGRTAELQGTLNEMEYEALLDELSEQALKLWLELGYSNASPFKASGR
jgi:hypothetical protein